jgi:hypothetical protein
MKSTMAFFVKNSYLKIYDKEITKEGYHAFKYNKR